MQNSRKNSILSQSDFSPLKVYAHLLREGILRKGLNVPVNEVADLALKLYRNKRREYG